MKFSKLETTQWHRLSIKCSFGECGSLVWTAPLVPHFAVKPMNYSIY